jgi:hypothetical protein
MNPLQFLNAIKGYGAKAAPRVFQGAIDTVTDPQTYRRLAVDAERLLGRNLPPQFAGSNFGNIPARATGLISDLAETSGLQRAVQGGMTGRAIQEMAGIAPKLARTATQTAEGLLRAPSIGQGLTRQITTRLPEAAQALDPFARDYGLTRDLMKRAGGGMQSVAESLLPKQAFNTVGGVGGLIQNLNKAASPLFQSSNIVKNIPGIGSLPGFARNMLVPASPAGVAFAVAGLEGSSPQGFDNWRQLGYRSKEDMQNKVNTQTTKEGIIDTGRYIPGDQQKTIFTKQVDSAPPVTTPPVDPRSTQAGTLNTGVGTPDQRRVIEERNYQTQLSNAKQQYATPDPMSPDFQGYPNELAAQYGLEQSYGQELKQAGTLVPQLQEAGAGAGMTPENFAAWAKANPGLAVRLLSQGQRN